MEREFVTSRANPLLTRVRRLNSRRAFRRAEGAFAAEGPKLLAEALRWGGELEAVICVPGSALPELPARTRVVEVEDSLLASIADTESPQGIVFICKGKNLTVPDRLAGNRYLLLDGVQDPGNVGTILRTADAFDCAGVFLLPGCADLYSPKTVRAGMGVHFRIPPNGRVYQCGTEELAGLFQRSDIPLYAAALRDDTVDVRDAEMERCAVVIGSEGRGVSQQVLSLCKKTVKIPMSPRCESLNAAVAASVILWEMARGR